jgi:aspartate kinase
VGDPKHLPELDLAVLAEMAEAGAKVLNAQAVEWARRHKVAIHARRTSDPVTGGKETVARVRDDEDEPVARVHDDENRPVRAIVGASNVTFARVARASLARLLATAGELELTLGDVVSAGDHAFVHVPLANVPDWQRCARELERALGDDVSLEGRHAVASVVGYGLTGTSGALARALATLEGAGASPVCVSGGPLRISATIAEDRLDAAQRALHAAFVGAA